MPIIPSCLKHPLPIFIAISAGVDTAYYLLAIMVFHMPSGRYPHWYSILGVILINALALKCWFSGETKAAFGMTFLSVLVAIGFVIAIVAEILGAGTGVYDFAHWKPFAKQ